MIRFDNAWSKAQSFMEDRLGRFGGRAVLVRDLYGRIRIGFDDRQDPNGLPNLDEQRALAQEVDRDLGPFSPGVESLFLSATSMFAPEELFDSPDAIWANPSRKNFRTLDRSIVGSDWLREPFAESLTRRVTLYGIKGGVGRSTAAAVLAWRLSQAGRRVLVLDLDLESPGVGSALLPPERMPDFGVVDWFVEDAVGQADDGLLRDIVASSPLGEGGADLLVVPAGGRPREGYSYLPKLARAYAEITQNSEGMETFADRLNRMVGMLEDSLRPDIVLLDSRAGLHDIAAVTVTRLGALSLLFAVDTAQTWQAYRTLFQTWHVHFDRAEKFRENLKIVAAQIPETQTAAYLESFQQQAYDLFADNLYVETSPGEEPEFNFDLGDPDAPHSPLVIQWSRPFQQFDPAGRPEAVTTEQVKIAFSAFVRGVSLLILGEPIE
jgi:hypothetical protein